MKAAQIMSFGAPDVLRVTEIDRPSPGAGEVLVSVEASSVNGHDTIVRAGGLKMVSGRKFPIGIGLDFAGVVVATGPGVDGLPCRGPGVGHGAPPPAAHHRRSGRVRRGPRRPHQPRSGGCLGDRGGVPGRRRQHRPHRAARQREAGRWRAGPGPWRGRWRRHRDRTTGPRDGRPRHRTGPRPPRRRPPRPGRRRGPRLRHHHLGPDRTVRRHRRHRRHRAGLLPKQAGQGRPDGHRRAVRPCPGRDRGVQRPRLPTHPHVQRQPRLRRAGRPGRPRHRRRTTPGGAQRVPVDRHRRRAPGVRARRRLGKHVLAV